MVWWSSQADARPVKNARTHETVCGNCGNTTQHVLFRVKGGVGFGNPFTGRMWASTRSDWILVCPTCEDFFEVTKDVAASLQSGQTHQVVEAGAAPGPSRCSCGAVLVAGARFCGTCGRQIR